MSVIFSFYLFRFSRDQASESWRKIRRNIEDIKERLQNTGTGPETAVSVFQLTAQSVSSNAFPSTVHSKT